MFHLNEHIWIGGSQDERSADLGAAGIGAILNVAQDLQCTRGWGSGIEYAQVGIVDGPGNTPVTYHAAVLTLASLLKRHHQVLVCCHDGCRSMAVVLAYMQLMASRGWDGWIEIIKERVDEALPIPNNIHRVAFDGMNWGILGDILKKE